MGYRRRQPPDTMQSDRIKSWPADERPREKLLAHGAESLSLAELVAVVLRVGQGSFRKGVPGQNAIAFAKQLLNQFGGIEGLDRAHVEELSAVHGLGPAKVSQIKAAIELGKRASAGKLTPEGFLSSEDVAAHFGPLFAGKRQEKVIAVLLDGQNVPLAQREITEGTPTQATVYVRRVVEEALRVSAAAVVLVHNHPSGSARPSAGDDDTTRDLIRACSLVGLILLDHIIIGNSDHYSYNDAGTFATLIAFTAMAVIGYVVAQRKYPIVYEWGRVAKLAVMTVPAMVCRYWWIAHGLVSNAPRLVS